MSVLEKLQQAENLRKKNERNLNILEKPLPPEEGTALVPVVKESHHDSPDLFRQSLAKRRHREKTASSGQPLLSSRPTGRVKIDGGQNRTNECGSYLYRKLDSPDTWPNPEWMRSGKLACISGLVCQLQGEALPSELSQIAFLDTETTGLSGGTGNYAFLVGIASWEKEKLVVDQYLMRDFHEEPAMLAALAERLKSVRVLVTFNGKSFDVPLLKSRFTMARRTWPLNSHFHLDLLFPARRIWKLRLGDCRLGNLEKEVLGTGRMDDVPGYLIPQIYFEFTRSGNPVDLIRVLEHNVLDLVSLAQLTLKVGEILHGKQKNSLFPEDLFSVGNYFQQCGEFETARSWNQAALNFPLERELRLSVLRNLAVLYRTRKLYSNAAELWTQMVEESSTFQEEAYEALSIHYEHREKDLAKALEMTGEALRLAGRDTDLNRWMHRRNRLLRKIQLQRSSSHLPGTLS
ncbi:MAG: ribonuclease H-like domain-containing protein [Terriglobia bacterium]